MNKNDMDDLDKLFSRLQGEFDTMEPQQGHLDRFREKLNLAQWIVSLQRKGSSWWKPLSIAASVALLALLGLQLLGPNPSLERQLVNMAPEVGRTEFYFANLIERQVKELQSEKTPETARLVDDVLVQLERMEKDYKQLELDLVQGGDSKIIISAMINNFQTRIDLLREVSAQMENIKNLKSQRNESTTI